MIVMKFGGSSVASATAIEWVAGIVKSRLERHPVVVVSAMGKTTDRLEEALQHAARGSSYSAWCLFEELRRFHFPKPGDSWARRRWVSSRNEFPRNSANCTAF